MIGARFGRLVVQSEGQYRADLSYSNRKRWNCLCDCGRTKIVSDSNLKSGKTKSCGCLRNEKSSSRNLKDMTGIRFGKLVVIERAKQKTKGASWVCVCDCGNTAIVTGNNLRTGHTESCGCSAKNGCSREYKRSVGAVTPGCVVTTRDGDWSNLTIDNLCVMHKKDLWKVNRLIKGAQKVPELKKTAIALVKIEREIREIEKGADKRQIS